MAYKLCRRCCCEKPFTMFGLDARYADGMRPWCRECHREYGRQWVRANPQKQRERALKWQAQNPEKVAEANRKFKRANKDALAEQHAKLVELNRHKRNESCARRRAAKMRAMPSWVDRAEIAEIYRVARQIQSETGVKMNVDHIHPLQGEGFCGLHVPWNLQIITATENQRKKNKLPTSDELKRPRLPLDEPVAKPVQEVML